MPHTILSLHNVSFDTRTVFGGCLLNINGETYDCEIRKDSAENFQSPTYTVINSEDLKELCTFRPYHLRGGPLFFQIEGASNSGGDATLVVPDHGFLSDREENMDDDADHNNYYESDIGI